MNKIFKIGSTAAIASTLLVLAPTSAFADDNEAIQLSTENSNGFSNHLEKPVILSVNATNEDPKSPAIVVPGDKLQGSLTVKNSGPTKGVLKAYVVNMKNSGPDSIVDDEWFDDSVIVSANGKDGSLVYWSEDGEADQVGTSGLSGVQIYSSPIDKDSEVTLDFAVNFPDEATSGNSAGENAKPNGVPNDYSHGVRKSSFDVYLTLEGDDVKVPESQKPSPEPSNPVSPNPSPNKPGNPNFPEAKRPEVKTPESITPKVHKPSERLPKNSENSEIRVVEGKVQPINNPATVKTGGQIAEQNNWNEIGIGLGILAAILTLGAFFVNSRRGEKN